MGMSNYVMDEEEAAFEHQLHIHMRNGLTAPEAFAAAMDDLDEDSPDEYNRLDMLGEIIEESL